MRTVPDLLEAAVADFGDRPAIWHEGERMTWAQLGARVEGAAALLADRGVRPGDRVGVGLSNGPAVPVAMHAVWRLGATVVSVNPLYAQEAAAGILADAGARVVVGEGGLTAADVLGATGTAPRVDVDPATHVAILQYTGGTTGAPKGAMLSHANLTEGHGQFRRAFPVLQPGEERLFTSIPLSHVSGLVLGIVLSAGLAAEMVLPPRFDPDGVVALVEELRPTFLPVVPTMATALLRVAPGRPDRWSSVKVVTCGAAPLAIDLQRRFEERIEQVVHPSYGGTETTAFATVSPGARNAPGSSGLPVPGTTIELRELQDPAKPAAPGEPGEIVVRGPQVALGYWQKPEETATYFADGAFRSGDIGRVDEDGFLFVVDRLKDMIIASGYNVYPATVERAVFTHPAVAETIVVGVPDDYRGETVKAYVVLQPGQELTLDELQAHLRPRLSPMELPRLLEVRDELPKTAVGKLSRQALREEARA